MSLAKPAKIARAAPSAEAIDIAPADFFALRTPLLPFAELAALSEGLAATPDGAESDLRIVEARLRALVGRSEIREALFLASPTLDAAIDAWLAEPSSPPPPRARGVATIVSRYVARMCSRPTPFGLFSGCSVGRVRLAEETRLALAPRGAYRRHTRLDMHYVVALSEALEGDPELRRALRFRPSSALFPSADQHRYIEAHVTPDTRERRFQLVSVDTSDYLAATLARASVGAGATVDALAEPLVDDDVTLDDARAFVGELVATQLLVSELAPNVTGPEPLDAVLDVLRARAPEAPATRVVADVRAALRAHDEAPVGLAPAHYRALAETLAALPAKAEISRLFQVDLYKPTAVATLGPGVVRALEEAIATCVRLGDRPESRGLRRFREAFEERYEEREVPLAEALDEERGVGFARDGSTTGDPSPLLAGLVFPPSPEAPAPDGHRLDGVLLARAFERARDGATTWELTDADLAELAASKPAVLPDAFAAMATLAAASPEALAAGDFSLVLHGVSGPSGASLLGRFCHGDAELRAHVDAHLRAEEALQPEAIFAEIVHLPEGRLGNILCRPMLRRYEIPYLGVSGAPEVDQIPITDLLVSIRRGQIVLRSARLGRQVLPRLTTAHNHAASELGVYRFLCALQEGRGVGWSWGSLGARVPFLPRVTRGRAVLALARWNLGKRDIIALAGDSPRARVAAAQALRARLRLPRWVSLADGDNTLPVDLDNAHHIEGLVALLKGRDGASLTELFPGPGELFVGGGSSEGAFTHELVLPFTRRRAPAPLPAATTTKHVLPRVRRAFAPGSEWLYAKLYAGVATADHLLRAAVTPVVAAAFERGDATSWFFIRYADPHPHLRVRLFGAPDALAARVLSELHAALAPLIGDGRTARVEVATYVREIERYGGDAGMPLAEALFHADSDAALTIVQSLAGDAAADARWRLALLGQHRLLLDLGMGCEARLMLLTRVRASFGREFHADAAFDRELGARFRNERRALEALLAGEVDDLALGADAFAARSERVEPIATDLRARAACGELTAPLEDLAASFLHMHANRMLRAEHRAQELVLYDFLRRLYDAERARTR